MFACHLHNSSGMCLHLAWTNHVSAESPSKSPLTPKKNLKKPKKKTKKSPPRGEAGSNFFLPQFFLFFFRSPCKISEPYDNPFWKNSDGGREKEKRGENPMLEQCQSLRQPCFYLSFVKLLSLALI